MQGFEDFKDAYLSICRNYHCLHVKDTLPSAANYEEPDSDESDTETVQDDRENEDFVAEWMREAARWPNQEVEPAVDNLGM